MVCVVVAESQQVHVIALVKPLIVLGHAVVQVSIVGAVVVVALLMLAVAVDKLEFLPVLVTVLVMLMLAVVADSRVLLVVMNNVLATKFLIDVQSVAVTDVNANVLH